MRTPNERREARSDLMAGVSDHDVTVVQAIVELCATLDDLGERLTAALDQLDDGSLVEFLKATALMKAEGS